MKLPAFFSVLFGLILLCSTACRPEMSDLTINIVGIYSGTVALNLDTDSLTDVENQRLEIVKVDDETVEIRPMTYPDSSPVDTLVLTAKLTPTPYGFINTRGVMLSIDQIDYTEGTVKGVPFSISGGGDLSEDGKFVDDTGEILFTLQIFKNGVDHYELFEGTRQ